LLPTGLDTSFNVGSGADGIVEAVWYNQMGKLSLRARFQILTAVAVID
jgi:hypothetical protein